MKPRPAPRAARGWQAAALLCLLCVAQGVMAAAPQLQPAAAAETVRSFIDIPFARVDGQELLLDLFLPRDVTNPPLVIYLHGGAWRVGDKSEVPSFLAERGFAVASLEFRSSEVARFPANVHDIKAGIRFLRAQAAKYGYRADRIALTGSSSGGHLAALVGTTNGMAELEGEVGEHRRESSSVQAIISWAGASNISTIIEQSTPTGLKLRVPAVQSLLGALPEEVPELARLASPVTHVDRGDPPILLLHGDQDVNVPVNQSLELQGAYRRAGLVAELHIINGVGHTARPFFGPGEAQEIAVEFLERTIGR